MLAKRESEQTLGFFRSPIATGIATEQPDFWPIDAAQAPNICGRLATRSAAHASDFTELGPAEKQNSDEGAHGAISSRPFMVTLVTVTVTESVGHAVTSRIATL